MNVYGCYALFIKEIRRFYSVILQTIGAPVVTALLYMAVFSQVLRGETIQGVPSTAFLVPGLMMMSVIQNAFANTSSSFTQSKVMGNLVFMLMTPLSPFEIYLAYTAAAVARGCLVALVLFIVTNLFVSVPITHPGLILLMLLLSGGTLAVIGLIAGILAEKFDHLAAFQNFFIVPMSFLSGIFYSIHSLPPFWQKASYFNPFFYMIDGFRRGFFGVGDANVVVAMSVAGGFFVAVSVLAIWMLGEGFRIRS
ncbi:ABC transporter permease [Salinisphaera sp. USBA-960]|uniref:ABC transporter permease n=1 Tax=Salinisphaera orenii TaxID=856731 RepID=UPI000DBE220D|nr:ABC transporter permease [Salifodinibacter halophilus]NNC26777.1 ABC transporter permease [Salifodinibacter halophilus]